MTHQCPQYDQDSSNKNSRLGKNPQEITKVYNVHRLAELYAVH